VLLALALAEFRDLIPFANYLNIAVIAVIAYLKFNQNDQVIGLPKPKISFWESLKPLPECRDCYIDMLGGFAVVLLGMLTAVLSYRVENYFLGTIFALVGIFYGTHLINKYIRCLSDYERGYRGNDT
jgi:hypothetical protein